MRSGPLSAVFAVLLVVGGCRGAEDTTNRPALWEVIGPDGARGWIFGTIHALPDGIEWRTPAIDRALEQSDSVVLEIVDPADENAARSAFARLGATPGQPPLADRIRPDLRDELRAALARTRLQPGQFASLEDWAAALTLSFALEADKGFDPDNGADRALLADAGKRPVKGLETLEGQLGLFDALAPREQRALLEAVIAESADTGAEQRLLTAWASGDTAALDREAHAGLLANPRLRAALLVERNRRWADQVAQALRDGDKPFVAVGAAHVAGVEGVPALLAAQGFEVQRVQ